MGPAQETDMKRYLWLVLLLAAGGAQAAEPSPQGQWARGDGKARVVVEPCGEDLCAVNTWIKPGTRDEKVGDKLVMAVRHSGMALWRGKAFDPQRNQTYGFTMKVQDRTMTTTGCILGVLCKDMGWTRLE